MVYLNQGDDSGLAAPGLGSLLGFRCITRYLSEVPRLGSWLCAKGQERGVSNLVQVSETLVTSCLSRLQEGIGNLQDALAMALKGA